MRFSKDDKRTQAEKDRIKQEYYDEQIQEGAVKERNCDITSVLTDGVKYVIKYKYKVKRFSKQAKLAGSAIEGEDEDGKEVDLDKVDEEADEAKAKAKQTTSRPAKRAKLETPEPEATSVPVRVVFD
jgi:hypothetical protein